MQYTELEKDVLSLVERTDFKNLSKNDFITYASKLNELRPEVAIKVIEKFPELASFMLDVIKEYSSELSEIIKSDNESIEHVYAACDKELDQSENDLAQIHTFALQVQSDLSKCLEKENITPEETKEIIDREIEILRFVSEKDSEKREHDLKLIEKVDEKDKEKRQYNWKLIGAVSSVALFAVGVTVSALGGNLNIKLPKKL